jgi:hypothetical protein
MLNRRTRAIVMAVTCGLAVSAAVPAALAAPATSTGPRVDFHAWTTQQDFRTGAAAGLAELPGPRLGVVMTTPVGTAVYQDPYLNTTKTYTYSTWTSPSHSLAFGATELVSSWNAQTPAGTWLKVELDATMEDGNHTGWLDMGDWASGDGDIARTSTSPVAAPYGEVDTDTFSAYTGHSVQSYQLRATLYRLPGSTATPRLWQVGAFASDIPDRQTVPASIPGLASHLGIELPVPSYSQDIHAGQYPQWDGGGEAWCSPTSNEMVDEYWGVHPSKEQLAFVDPSYQDPTVDVAARGTYDYSYQGTGNWPFNAAYASSYGLDAEIVQLRSLDDVERLVASGIPVITSQAFEKGEITGANYNTSGHLWVIVGFTTAGDVIVNDPASPTDAAVRHVYPRRQFEDVWLRTTWKKANGHTGYGSGGVAYVIKPHWLPLPPVIDRANPSW